MGKKNNDMSDLLASLGTSDDSGDEGTTSGKKKSREGGRIGSYRRVTEVMQAHIARAEEQGSDDVVEALTNALKAIHVVRDTSALPPGASRHFIGIEENGTLVAFDCPNVPTPDMYPDYVKVYGPYRKSTGLAFRMTNGIPAEESIERLVFSRKNAA